MKVMWLKAFTKAKAGVQILQFTSDITKKIQILGIWKGIKKKETEEKRYWFIIMPHSLFKSVWNVVLIVLLIYTATYMPYKICFIDEPTSTSEIIDSVVDWLFAIDIIVNFISAVELADGNIAIQPKPIANMYIRSWFLFDLVAVFPFQQIIS